MIKTNIITHKYIRKKYKKIKESVNLLTKIPAIKDYITSEIIVSKKSDSFEIRKYLPPQISTYDLKNVTIIASAKLKHKKKVNDEIFITVCDVDTALKSGDFYQKIKKKISNSKKTHKNINLFNNSKLQGFSFEYVDDMYTVIKKKNEPKIVTILKTKIQFKKAISTFTALFEQKNGILQDEKVKKELFILPSSLPTGFKFLEFYLERIPKEYVIEKPNVGWAEKMVGKLNLSAVYIDKSKTLWTINLFNLENESEAKSIYDEYFSKDKEVLLKKMQDLNSNDSEQKELYSSILEMTGQFEKIQIGPYKGWFVENKIRNNNEISFRASQYLITIFVNKAKQKKILIQLANSLQINKIIDNGIEGQESRSSSGLPR